MAQASASPSGRGFILHRFPGVTRAKSRRALPPATIKPLPFGEESITLQPVASVTAYYWPR